MFELQLGTEFFYRADLCRKRKSKHCWLNCHPQTIEIFCADKYFFFLLKSDRHKKGKKQTNKKKNRKKQNTTIKPQGTKVSKSDFGVCRSQLLVCFALKF